LSFIWAGSNRRLSVGSNLGAATLTVHDGSTSGATTLMVRAGHGQGNSILQTWQNAAGLELASVGPDGVFAVRAMESVSTSTRPAWRETGTSADPSVRLDGDAWFNSAELSHKTVEGGKTHTVPQVLCASTGTTYTETSMSSMGSCTVPAGMARPGDRLAIRATWVHSGSATYSVRWRWGTTTAGAITVPGSVTALNQKGEVVPYDSGAVLEGWASYGGAAFIDVSSQTAASGITIGFEGNVGSSGETLRLVQFSVIRFPAQSNP
jgi:hypothetical protein